MRDLGLCPSLGLLNARASRLSHVLLQSLASGLLLPELHLLRLQLELLSSQLASVVLKNREGNRDEEMEMVTQDSHKAVTMTMTQ